MTPPRESVRLYISKTNGALVQGAYLLSPITVAPTIKLATDEPMEIQYLNADGAPELLPAGKLPFLGVKAAGYYDDVFAVKSGDLTAPATAAGFYTGLMDCATSAFGALLGNSSGSTAPEKDSVALMGEVVYPSDATGKFQRSQTFSIVGLNRVVTGSEP